MKPILYKIIANGNSFLVMESQSTLDTVILHHERVLFSFLLQAHSCDSFLLLGTSTKLPSMRIFERDLTESKMCGNGIRALAFLLHTPLGNKEISFQTKAGIFSGKCSIIPNSMVITVGARLKAQEIIQEKRINNHTCTLVDTGEPHAIFYCESAREQSQLLQEFSKILKETPEKLLIEGNTYNLNFDIKKPTGTFHIRTIERGVNRETKSCGTGTIATAYFLKTRGESFPLTIETRGGTLQVREYPDNTYELIGTIDHFSIIPLHTFHADTQRSFAL